jgi:hypothetical protein
MLLQGREVFFSYYINFGVNSNAKKGARVRGSANTKQLRITAALRTNL